VTTLLLRRFAALFRGRTDAWGALHGQAVREPITARHWHDHLHGDGSLGIYPLVDGKVAWGCTDVDDGYEASLPLARNLWRVLTALGVTSWVEVTKSKGFHVWTFVDGWVEAEAMRHALLFAHQVAGVTPSEVNPKQTSSQSLGNYVNVPYAAAFAAQQRRVVLTMPTLMPLRWEAFTDAAHAALTPPALVREVAGRYRPPPPPPKMVVERHQGELEPLVKVMPGLAHKLFQEGPREGKDRSGVLMRLAHLLAESGRYGPDQVLALVADADSRWGKFSERADGEAQLQAIVTRAWGKATAPPHAHSH
jgi:hypothetical protein